MIKISDIDIKSIKGFPDKASLQIRNNQIYVIRRSYYYDKNAKRGKETRDYIGRVVDNQFYSMEDYHAKFKRNGGRRVPKVEVPATETVQSTPINSGAKSHGYGSYRLGCTLIFNASATETALYSDLTSVFGKEVAATITSLAFFMLCQGENAMYNYNDWHMDYTLPFNGDISSKDCSAFLSDLGQICQQNGKMYDFFKLRLSKISEDEFLSVDGTYLTTESSSSFTEIGKSKKGTYGNQIGFSLILGHDTGVPVMFRVLPGNLHDISTVPEFIRKIKSLSSATLAGSALDRGFFSEKVIAEGLKNNLNLMICCCTSDKWIASLIREHLDELNDLKNYMPDFDCTGIVLKVTRDFDDYADGTVYVALYKNATNADRSTNEFMHELNRFKVHWELKDQALLKEKSLMKYFIIEDKQNPGSKIEFNIEKIRQHCATFGVYGTVALVEQTKEYYHRNYERRDIIEKTFKGCKTEFDFDVIRAHNDNTLMGRMMVSFVAMTIMNDIKNRMHNRNVITQQNGKVRVEDTVAEEYSFKGLLRKFKAVRLLQTGSNYCISELTKGMQDILRKLGFEKYASELPTYTDRTI